MSALNVSSASQSGSLKIFRRGLLSHVTLEATEHTMLGHNRMTQNKFGDDIRTRIDIKSSTKKNHKPEKKGTPPSPQVFRNLFDNVRSEIKILSQTNTNYIGRPSTKRDYTNSSECCIVNPKTLISRLAVVRACPEKRSEWTKYKHPT